MKLDVNFKKCAKFQSISSLLLTQSIHMVSEDLESTGHVDYFHMALMLLFSPFAALKALVPIIIA